MRYLEDTEDTAVADKPKSNTERALVALREMILSNQLPAGSSHLETELANRLGMSRTPIREAALVLQSQGLLEVKPRHGVRITAISPEDMKEIYQILTELESLSAQLAAEKGLSEAELKPLEDAMSEMEAALAEDDRHRWAQADEAFHDGLVALGGNGRIGQITSMYNDQVRRVRTLTLFLRPKPTKSNEDHREVVDAIRSGDGERAFELHRAHRIRSGELLVDILVRHGFSQV